MEQEEGIDGLLCETPSLLPALSLSLASSEGPQAPEGHALGSAPAAAVAAPAQTAVSSLNQGKGIKVREQKLMAKEKNKDIWTFLIVSNFINCLFFYLLFLFF